MEISPNKSVTEDISSINPLVFPGQYFFILQAYGKERIPINFEIPEADRTLRKLGERALYIALGVFIAWLGSLILP